MTDQTTPTPLDQPDGIDEQSRDLPDPVRAAARVRAYIEASGDGLYDVQGGMPLYARDLEALTRVVLAAEAPIVLRPAPVGSWWETPDGAAYVDGDYLDGPGDQIVTYVLHRPDGGRSYGKWGGREFPDTYTRLDGPPAWLAAETVAEGAR